MLVEEDETDLADAFRRWGSPLRRARVVWLDEPTVLPEWFVEETERICDLTVYRDMPDVAEVVRRLGGR